MRHANLILLLVAIASMGFMCTHQWNTVKLLDGQLVQTVSREIINWPGPGTDFVYASEWTCPKNVGEEDATPCVKTGQAYGSGPSLTTGLFSGAALGAFFPLIRPSTVSSTATGGSGGDATAKGGNVTIKRPRRSKRY